MTIRPPRAVVVGVDASESARDAAEWAADIATLWGAPLHLVHVVPAAPYDPLLATYPSWLTELCDAATTEGADPHDTEVGPGGTVELPADGAADARLVVLGGYGTGAWSGMLAGSVALALLELVPCPVVVVRGTAPKIPPPRRGPIVVGVDGSPAGRAALRFAADLAALLGTRLTAVHSRTDVGVEPDGSVHRIIDDRIIDDRIVDNRAVLAAGGAAVLDAELAAVAAAHPTLPIGHEVVEDPPLRVLLARAGEARVLVVGHRSGHPGSGMLLGSMSQALVEFASCPIAVIKPAVPGAATAS